MDYRVLVVVGHPSGITPKGINNTFRGYFRKTAAFGGKYFAFENTNANILHKGISQREVSQFYIKITREDYQQRGAFEIGQSTFEYLPLPGYRMHPEGCKRFAEIRGARHAFPEPRRRLSAKSDP
ncbi:hypothetical protein TcasGA2_TC009581 [Tribolium castaneum]|uniref:Uncharacterized protein n=1 Tax=Tribolium castaneum TaxID=7070 RepID=D6WST6_TRICA|nr:hypothetical protein TcasGA2_TC009581 [Tribolium castaneum]